MRVVAIGLAAIMALTTPLTAAAQSDEPSAPRFLRIGAGQPGGVYLPVAGLIANALSAPPGGPACEDGGACGVPNLIAVAEASEGSVDNLAALRDGRVAMALVQADRAAGADEDSIPLRALAALHAEVLHVIVLEESPASSLSDLVGATLALGEKGSGTRQASLAALAAFGVEAGAITEAPAAFAASAGALSRGEVAAAFFFAGAPAQAVTALAQTTPVRFLPLDGPPIQQLIAGTTYYREAEVPAGLYAGLDASAPTIGVGALLMARADMADDLVTELLTALWREENRSILDGGHPAGRSITLQSALRGVSTALHPAAAAFYRQAGVADGALD
ncbi:MAG: TAXI family TRAP transporter solute-binding subunit [Pseudomonadota bacterium]